MNASQLVPEQATALAEGPPFQGPPIPPGGAGMLPLPPDSWRPDAWMRKWTVRTPRSLIFGESADPLGWRVSLEEGPEGPRCRVSVPPHAPSGKEYRACLEDDQGHTVSVSFDVSSPGFEA